MIDKKAHQDAVRDGYNIIAPRYHEGRVSREAVNIEWLDELLRLLPQTGRVVDLGCGAGVPITRYFASHGYAVEGYDLSKAMIDLARTEVPGARFTVASIEDLNFETESIDMIVSFFAIIHVPRDLHAELYGRMFRWLRPGGAALLSLGAGDNPEQTDESWHGARMKWSHFDAETNLGMLRTAGFEIAWSELDGPSEDRHLFVIATK